MSVGRILGISAAFVAAFAVVTSVWLNPPWENRARILDAQRRSQLSSIESALNSHFRANQRLPASLDELQQSTRDFGRTILLDPGTGQPFQYEILNEKDYRLCAIFKRSTEDDAGLAYARQHKAGRDCFERKIIAIKP